MSALVTNIRNGHKEGKEGTWDFNCWGATLYALGEMADLVWICASDMMDFLNEKTREVTEQEVMQKGDILVLYGYDEDAMFEMDYNEDGDEIVLIHTAIYLGRGIFWHKMGANKSEFATQEEVVQGYEADFEYSEVRRLKN